MEDWQIIAAAALAGLLVGAALYVYQPASQGYCKSLENDIRNNKTFNGTVACFPPGTPGINTTGISNDTELRCVCTKSYLGKKQTFAVTVPK